MDRYEIVALDNKSWGIREDMNGRFVFTEKALWYQRQYRMSLVINVVVVLICAVLAGYLVYHKHDPQPVQQTGVNTERYAIAVEEQRTLRAEVELSRKKIKDLMRANELFRKEIWGQNIIRQQREKQLKALSISVPPQPIILQAIQQEAKTDVGLRQAVARNFGLDIAGRMKVRE